MIWNLISNKNVISCEEFSLQKLIINLDTKTRKKTNEKKEGGEKIRIYLYEDIMLLTKMQQNQVVCENVFEVKDLELSKKEMRKFEIKCGNCIYSLKTDTDDELNL
jgi:hypothetical protein